MVVVFAQYNFHACGFVIIIIIALGHYTPEGIKKKIIIIIIIMYRSTVPGDTRIDKKEQETVDK